MTPTPVNADLLASCKELRDAGAAAARVLMIHGLADRFIAELRATTSVADGFGIRARDAIAKAEGHPPQ